MRIPKYPDTGYIIRTRPTYGELQTPNTNVGYDTPYQFTYRGQAVLLAKSSTYDVDATPTVLVAVPCTSGSRPDGYIAVPAVQDDPRPGATGVYLPLTADLTLTDSQSIAYTGDMTLWANAGVVPFREGDQVGLPLYPSQTVVTGDELCVATGGLYRKAATTGEIIVAKVELAPTAVSTSVQPVWCRIINKYAKA